jgi:hypothetical protein
MDQAAARKASGNHSQAGEVRNVASLGPVGTSCRLLDMVMPGAVG